MMSSLFKKYGTMLIFFAILVGITYFNSLDNSFVSDDNFAIPQQGTFLGSLNYIFSQPTFFARTVLYFFAYHIGEINPWIYRIINIFFHIGAVFVLYILAIKLTKKPLLAFFSACLFAVHPLLSESVSWISGGIYAQYSFFLLSSFLSYILSQNNKRWFLFSLMLFVLALSTSEKAIAFPLIIGLYEFLFGNIKKNWFSAGLFFLVSFVWFFIIYSFIVDRLSLGNSGALNNNTFLSNPLVVIPVAIFEYLKLIFWPFALTIYHSEMVFTPLQYYFRLGFFIVILLLLFYFFFKNKWYFFWFAFFLIALSPTLTPLKISWVVAERYVYFGSIGIFMIVATILEYFSKIPKLKFLVYLIFIFLIIFLMVRTIIRNMDWQNEDSLWIATGNTSPSSAQNHNNLGDVYSRHGKLEAAAEEFKYAIFLSPSYADAYHNLANTYQQMNQIDLAIENYKKALSFNPNLWQSHENLGAVYYSQNNYQKAIDEFKKAIALTPQYASLYTNLGVIYLKYNQPSEAKKLFEAALAIDPNQSTAKLGLSEIDK